jgi:60 kDa SS-A/Ro ribonucleoprotein
VRVVERAVHISLTGRAPKNDPALWVLALATKYGNDEVRKQAYASLPKVARIGTHLFTFVEFRESLGGWGAGMRRAVSNWYTGRKPDSLAYQLLKYRQRGGWSHRDLLRLAHPVTDSLLHKLLFDYVCHPDQFDHDRIQAEDFPTVVKTYARAHKAHESGAVVPEYAKDLTREMLPTEWLKNVGVWHAMLPKMPITAMIRNLGVMSANGSLKPLTPQVKHVVSVLKDEEILKGGRVHPIQLLMAQRTYAAGQGFRGGATWRTIPQIVDALDDAFYASFQNVEPTGKRYLLGVDVSGSMGWSGYHQEQAVLTPREIAAAMAMTFLKTESEAYAFGFSTEFVDLGLSPKMRLDDVIRKTSNLPFAGTDCSLPMRYATKFGLEVDAFVVITDNETWYGNVHPFQALDAYRRKTGIPAKLVVLGVTSTGFTIADPSDAGMLDVVGFDAAVPRIVGDFMRG